MARKNRAGAPEVNAGSMADIAFLLLIFFLVTTTIQTDQGINRKLPPIDETQTDPPPIKEKNIFTVLINKNDQLLVEDVPMDLKDLREAAIAFLDNGGDGSCSYCKGAGDIASSDNPDKAIISLQNDSETSYEAYISVQNELVAAYYFLRDRECKARYGKTFRELEAMFDDPRTRDAQRERIEPLIKDIQTLFPQKLSEAEPKR
ncbi:biopolymer transporter ExbD [Flavobacterium azooxidireducens]|uniref:Biopolymer transporter ExbD n=1 Tax=Flavobacterium azooxidireducens TaxID=1871076 RepID=A0ABY4KJ08_9FLAO|nr:biopolymer transporter ExbD [Flavobacterium azooxidireducens]UPQ80829.1 biopolymer transporter ExbD [Flavobacterium azooxidireducens]